MNGLDFAVTAGLVGPVAGFNPADYQTLRLAKGAPAMVKALQAGLAGTFAEVAEVTDRNRCAAETAA